LPKYRVIKLTLASRSFWHSYDIELIGL